MRLFCLIAFLFNVTYLLAQQPAISSDTSRILNGEDKVYRDSLLVAKYTYKNGVKEGAYTEFYYSSMGALIFKETGKFVAGLKKGRSRTFVFSEGKLYNAADNYYLDGQLQGLGSVMVATDTLMHAIYSRGVLNGYATWQAYSKVYDETGYKFSQWQFFQECYYKNGVRDGYYIEVVNDEISIIGKFVNGMKDSVWNFFVPYGPYKGELLYYFNFVNGLRQGPAESFFMATEEENNGFKTTVYNPINQYIEYRNDTAHGEFIQTTKEGVVIQKGFYVEGIRKGQWELSEWMNGVWVTWKGEMTNSHMNGRWNCYDDKKRLRLKSTMKNDTADGTWLYYDEQGNLTHERVFDMAKEVSVTNFEGMEDGFKSIGISFIPGDSNHLIISTLRDDVTAYETYILLLDSMPRLDTLANSYVNVRTGQYADSFMLRDGVLRTYTHDTLYTVQNFNMGHLNGEQVIWDYKQGVRFERTYDMDTLLDERFYFLDGRLYKGVCELISEVPPNREVIRVKKGRRKGYTEVYGRLTGRLIGRVKY